MMKKIDLKKIKTLFWDVDFDTLSWEKHRNFIIQRVLTHGNLTMFGWLREQIGDKALADWIILHKGRGLSPRQLRYWEVILELPASEVDHWVKAQRETIWEQRIF